MRKYPKPFWDCCSRLSSRARGDPNLLQHLVHNHFEGFNTCLRGLRLARTQMLLRTTNLSITEIAQQSGFGDSAQLPRAFKAALGITRRDYRCDER